MTIAAYTHEPPASTETPDTKPGDYFVSARDGDRFALVSGPFATHAQALAEVAAARRLMVEYDPKAHWYAFGTCRLKVSCGYVGFLERHGLRKPNAPNAEVKQPKPRKPRKRKEG